MPEIETVEKAILHLEQQIEPLARKLEVEKRTLATLKSREFIRINQIKIGDVEIPDGDKNPWFGDVWKFAEWLSLNSKRKWAAWNGRIYLASDLIAGRMPNSPAEYSDLEGAP